MVSHGTAPQVSTAEEIAAQPHQGAGERGVGKSLPAGDSEAAVGPVKETVPRHLVKNLARRYRAAHNGPGLGGAGVDAVSAGRAAGAVGAHAVGAVLPAGDRRLGTDADTAAAPGTFVRQIHELGRGGLGLRVGAPDAAQGAALDEHVGADARPVVDTEVLGVENGAGDRPELFQHSQSVLSPCVFFTAEIPAS